MKVLVMNGIVRRLFQIENAVKKAERKRCAASGTRPVIRSPRSWVGIKIGGAYDAGYASTSFRVFLGYMEKVARKLPVSSRDRFADLGSGLGMVCFSASLAFRNITGFEIDPKLVDLSRGIKKRFGIENVRIRNMDFLNANLSNFQVIYVYWPFINDYSRLIDEKLATTKPGTVIISRLYPHIGSRVKDKFKRVDIDTGGDKRFKDMYTFIRI